MKKLIKKTVLTLLVLLVVSLLLIYFFTSTTSGLKTLIRLGATFYNQPIIIHGTTGNLKEQSTIKELEYKTQLLTVKLKNLHIKWKLGSLLDHELPLEYIKADTVEIVQGDTPIILNNVVVLAELQNRTLVINSLSFNYLDLNINATLKVLTLSPYTFTSTIRLKPVGVGDSKQPSGVFNAAGDLNLINWSGDFHGPAEFSTHGTLRDLKHIDQIIKWRNFFWPNTAQQELLSKEGRVKITGTLPNLNIELTSKVNRTADDVWQINGSAQGVLPWNWSFNFNLLQPNSTGSSREGIYSTLSLSGNLKDPQNGYFNLKIAPGHYQLPKEAAISSLPFQGGQLTAHLTPQGLKGTGDLIIDAQKKLYLQFNLPHFSLTTDNTKKQRFSSALSVDINSLDFLSALIPDIKNPKGSLMVSLNAKGTFDKPSIKTNLALSKGSVEIPSLGLKLHSINSHISSEKNKWEGTASIRSNNQPLKIKGNGLITPQLTGDISIEGSSVSVIETAEYQVKVSPKLLVNYTPDLLLITGSILVPSAQIKLQSFTNSLSLSSDVVFEEQINKKDKTISSPMPTQINIKVEMGDQVELSAQGLKANLTGKVNILQEPQGTLSATGEFNVVKGNYKAYGQNLSIEQGEIFFTGGSIDNPGINLRASKKINTSSPSVTGTNQLLDFNSSTIQSANLRGNITVGVEVSGRLIEPEIQLFSNPAMLSQADILSMLVLGRPASQANKAGAQLLLTAISSMNLGGNTKGSQLLSQLKDNLGVDFNVETNSNYNLQNNTVSDSTALVVSKSLTKRMSLSYNVGLSQANTNVVTLKYILNKFFSIQISSSGASSGIDVLYTSSTK